MRFYIGGRHFGVVTSGRPMRRFPFQMRAPFQIGSAVIIAIVACLIVRPAVIWWVVVPVLLVTFTLAWRWMKLHATRARRS
jgi:hypothetical protein